MATGYCDPNGDDSIQWNPNSNNYQQIDDGVRQPSDPGTVTGVEDNGDGTIDIYNMTTIASVTSVSQVVIWVYGKVDGADVDTTDIDINMGGWEGAQTIPFSHGAAPAWQSVTFNGTWSQADLDGLQVKATANHNIAGANNNYEIYAEVTYSSAASSTSTGFMTTKSKYWGG